MPPLKDQDLALTPGQRPHHPLRDRGSLLAYPFTRPALWIRSLGGGVFAALRGGLVAAITQDWLQVGVAV
ncbi:hypothetical protein MICRO80W_570005 [Micrococcus luteus]|nr:hypothetical protein MICRO80W_570005 [Micrococcus luteus]